MESSTGGITSGNMLKSTNCGQINSSKKTISNLDLSQTIEALEDGNIQTGNFANNPISLAASQSNQQKPAIPNSLNQNNTFNNLGKSLPNRSSGNLNQNSNNASLPPQVPVINAQKKGYSTAASSTYHFSPQFCQPNIFC